MQSNDNPGESSKANAGPSSKPDHSNQPSQEELDTRSLHHTLRRLILYTEENKDQSKDILNLIQGTVMDKVDPDFSLKLTTRITREIESWPKQPAMDSADKGKQPASEAEPSHADVEEDKWECFSYCHCPDCEPTAKEKDQEAKELLLAVLNHLTRFVEARPEWADQTFSGITRGILHSVYCRNAVESEDGVDSDDRSDGSSDSSNGGGYYDDLEVDDAGDANEEEEDQADDTWSLPYCPYCGSTVKKGRNQGRVDGDSTKIMDASEEQNEEQDSAADGSKSSSSSNVDWDDWGPKQHI